MDTPSEQVFAKTERGGDVIVGLFNTSYGQPEEISTTAKALGLSGHGPYQVQDIYGNNSDLCASGSVDTANPTPTSVQTPLCGAGTPTSFETAGTISANVPPEGVAFYKITPIHAASPATPSTTVNLTGHVHPDRRSGDHRHRDVHEQRHSAGPVSEPEPVGPQRMVVHGHLADHVAAGRVRADRACHLQRHRADR